MAPISPPRTPDATRTSSSSSASTALPDEGVTWVHKGYLTATFLYATPGAEGLRQAVKLLKGEKIQPVITLPTMLIDKTNAADILKKNGLL